MEWAVRSGVMKKYHKTLILAFEAIVQPSKHAFEIGIFPRFSSLCIGGTLKNHQTWRKNVQKSCSTCLQAIFQNDFGYPKLNVWLPESATMLIYSSNTIKNSLAVMLLPI